MKLEIPYGYCHCGCGEKAGVGKQYIHNHHRKILPIAGLKVSNGYTKINMPNHPRADLHGYVYTHIVVAENALGKSLPPQAEIHHHSSGARFDNTQLVICQDTAYHKLLHKREAALTACGHANWLKCSFCGEYDDPKNLYTFKSRSRSGSLGSLKGHHTKCKSDYDKEYHQEVRLGGQRRPKRGALAAVILNMEDFD